MQPKSYLVILALIVCATFSLGACNTLEGAGRDVENVGEAVQDVAK